MANPTVLQLGAWNPLTDAFVPHPASPSGAILNLNDGVTWSLVDQGDDMGSGLDWGDQPPDILGGSNQRVVGTRITVRQYTKNREIKVHLLLGQMATFAAFGAALRALQVFTEAITADQPAALQIQVTGATTPRYADVVAAYVVTKYRELMWAQLLDDGIDVVFVCKPHFRGPQQVLDNLVSNPGFEAPSGPPVSVFTDSYANANAYTAISGAAPVVKSSAYYDAVRADGAIRYYRLDETSGTTAVDATASGDNGTYTGGYTLGAAGLITGDPNGAVALNGSSGYVMIPTVGLPTGNGAITLEAIIKAAALPTAGNYAAIFTLGTSAAGEALYVEIDSGGHLVVYNGTTVYVGTLAMSVGTIHHVAVTWDGTHLQGYVDGALVINVTPGAQNLVYGYATLGAFYYGGAYANFFNGTIDEAAIYSGAVVISRVGVHAGNVTVGTDTAMTVPNGSVVQFGSPAWSAVNIWHVRFQWVAGLQATFYLHYTDASNKLLAQVDGTNLTVSQVIGGFNHVLAMVTCSLANDQWEWLRFTQFPGLPGYAPAIQASIYSDNNAGGENVLEATVGPVATYDDVTALLGRPGFAASGAALTLGGNFASVHTVALFGPGGWTCVSENGSATGIASGAWEQAPANTFPNGPLTSFGAARLDLAPTGTTSCWWDVFNAVGTNPSVSTAMPVQTPGDTLSASVWIRSSGLGVNATVSLVLRDFDVNGNAIRSTVIASASGNQSAWTQLSGIYVTATNCAFSDLICKVDDASGGSSGGTVWFDNVQCWDVTATGQSSMPYCELRFPQAPAQLLLSGIQGDVLVPATVSLGIQTNLPTQTTLTFAVGRRRYAGAGARLVQAIQSNLSGGVPALDASAYGGFSISLAGSPPPPSSNLNVFSGGRVMPLQSPVDARGTYHLWARAYSTESVPGYLVTRALVYERYANAPATAQWEFYGNYVYPQTPPNIWSLIDSGQIQIPPSPTGALHDSAQVLISASIEWDDEPLGGSGSTLKLNWGAAIPTDGSLLLGQAGNPANSSITYTNGWIWLYSDGLAAGAGLPVGWTLSAEAAAIPNPGRGIGGIGTVGSGYPNVNPTSDNYLTLDPRIRVNGTIVNQLVAAVINQNGDVLPIATVVRYVPLFRSPF